MKQITAKNITLMFDSIGPAPDQEQIQAIIDMINRKISNLVSSPQLIQDTPRTKEAIINEIKTAVSKFGKNSFITLNDPVTYSMTVDTNPKEVVKIFTDGMFVNNYGIKLSLEYVDRDDLETVLERIIDNDPNDEEVA
jgi:hypothetical protein